MSLKRRISKKSKVLIAVLLVVTVISVSLASTVLIVADNQDRSSTSLFYEAILHIAISNSATEKSSYRDLEKARAKNEDYHVPKIYASIYGFDIEHFQDSEVCVFNKDAENTVMYLHGGAFIYQPLVFHYDFCKRLSEELNVKIVMPIYPKAPNYTYETVLPFCYDMYLSLLENTSEDNIVFMGDSAGATIIMSLSQYLYDNDTVQPKEIFAFSPCLDITLSNDDIDNYASLDPMLNRQDLQIKISSFVGDGDTSSPYVSPFYCDYDLLPTMTVFVGGHELFLPDCRMLNDDLISKDIAFNYFEFPYMNHTFAIFPMRESNECIQIIKGIWGI